MWWLTQRLRLIVLKTSPVNHESAQFTHAIYCMRVFVLNG